MCGVISNGLLLLVIATSFIHIAPTDASRRVVCYYANWPQYRPQAGRFVVANIDPYACTHLVFAFGRVENNRILEYEPNDRKPNGGAYKAMTNLKRINPNLVTLLGVGGWSHGPRNFSKMAATPQNRYDFIMDSINILRTYNFDGIDLDWEYPAKFEPSDKQRFSDLVTEMRTEYEREASRTFRKRLLIAIATAAGIENAQKAYDIQVIDKQIDMYNVMAYDFHGPWETFTGLATPMKSNFDTMTVSASLQWYWSQGATSSKINLGLSFYARTWTLETPGDFRLGASGPTHGKKGMYTLEPGALSHYEVCQLQRQGMKYRMDPFGQSMYGVLGDQFVTFENRESLAIKLNYIVALGLGGAMVWSLDHDDFNGQFCGLGRNPLLTLVSQKMSAAASLPGTNPQTQPPVIPQTPTPTVRPPYIVTPHRPVVTTVRTPAPVTQPKPVNPGTNYTPPPCPSQDVRMPDPYNCSIYYVCVRRWRFKYTCHGEAIYNPYSKRCENRMETNYRCPT